MVPTILLASCLFPRQAFKAFALVVSSAYGYFSDNSAGATDIIKFIRDKYQEYCVIFARAV